MKKDRFAAFFDAVMAIIMTIVVLGFAIPKGTNWSDMGNLGFQVVIYALSFFWLGMMWMNIHTLWHEVEHITRGIILINMIMLFFSSMIPFLVLYLGQNFMDRNPQVLYGIDVICITLCNQMSAELLKKYNPKIANEVIGLRRGIALDIIIKVVGLVLGIFVFPPLVTISIFVAMIVVAIDFAVMYKKKKRDKFIDTKM